MKNKDRRLTDDLIRDQLSSVYRVEWVADGCMVVTPFRYPDNTEITVYLVSDRDGRVIVGDRAEAADYAFVNGVGTGTIRERLKKAKRRINARLVEQEEISIEVDEERVAEAILRITEAVQDVCYSIYTRTSQQPARQFRAEVENFLAIERFSFVRHVQIQGRSGVRVFDYAIKGQKQQQLLLSMFEATTPATAITRAKVISYDYEEVKGLSNAVPPLAVVSDSKGAAATSIRSPEVQGILRAHVDFVLDRNDPQSIVQLLQAA